MTIQKIGKALYICGDHTIEDAKFYASLLKSPELGLTARQINAVRQGEEVTVRIQQEDQKNHTSQHTEEDL